MALNYWDTEKLSLVTNTVLPFFSPDLIERGKDYFVEDCQEILGVRIDSEDLKAKHLISPDLWVVYWFPEDRQAILLGGHANGRMVDMASEQVQSLSYSVVDVTEDGVASTTYYPVGWEEERRIWVFGTDNHWE